MEKVCFRITNAQHNAIKNNNMNKSAYVRFLIDQAIEGRRQVEAPKEEASAQVIDFTAREPNVFELASRVASHEIGINHLKDVVTNNATVLKKLFEALRGGYSSDS